MPFVIVFAALALKAALLASGTVPFNSDEAVVALMARHILAGERPVFFYGQAYMGSLDAFLIALAFRLLGPSVLAVRLTQVTLFVGVLLSTYWLGRELGGSKGQASLGVALMAVPPVLLSLYTTATLGGYVETLLFGNLLLIVGHKLATREGSDAPFLWLALGAVAGLGFWTMGLIVVYLVPVALVLLARPGWRRWPHYGLAAAAFLVGSSPWWWYNFSHDGAAWHALFEPGASLFPAMGWAGLLATRLFGLSTLGLSTLLGMRPPWSTEWTSLWLAPLIVAFYLAVLIHAARGGLGARDTGRALLWGLGGTFVAAMVGTRFGDDATGRYLLPLYVPLVMFSAELLVAIGRRSRPLATAILIFVLGFNLWGHVRGAMQRPPGITTQLYPSLQFDDTYDHELIGFLTENGWRYGYSHYWIAFKIIFLSGERVILAPRLPYKVDLSYSAYDDRYPPYSQRVAASDRVVYVTSQEPNLDGRLRAGFAELGVTYRERDIGPYRVFYDLSARVEPRQLSPESW